MRGRPRLRRRKRRASITSDRLTLGLAGVAFATAGSVLAGEVARLARRRTQAAPEPVTVVETAEQAIAATGHAAAQDFAAVVREGYGGASRHETILFHLLSGFVVSFTLIRLSTTGIQAGWWPFGNVRIGGRHIHHFVPGILLAFGSGSAAMLIENPRAEEILAIPFGAGVGLTFDEAALLLDLRDVYWTREGLVSVQVSLGLAAILGGTIMGLRMLRRGERRVEQAGLIPAA